MKASADGKRDGTQKADLPQSWDPPEEDREYYRDIQSGDLGWMVRREGKAFIKLDRPLQDLVRPYRKTQWQQEKEHRPLTMFQLTRVAFEADKQLCLVLGLHDKAKRTWENLTDSQRIQWRDHGPAEPIARMRLYRGIMSTMSFLTKKDS